MGKIKVYTKTNLSLKPGVHGAKMWAVGLEKTMLTYFEMEPNTVFPEHHHEAEQITLVLDGELTFTCEGKTTTLKAGDVIAIPSQCCSFGLYRQCSMQGRRCMVACEKGVFYQKSNRLGIKGDGKGKSWRGI